MIMADFEIDLEQWVDEAEAQTIEFARAFALRLQARVQERTPVLTGRLRASIQFDQPVESWTADEPITLGTNVEYARRIEYGFVGEDSLGRKYHQTGRGMFAAAVNDASEIAETVLADLQETR